MNRRIAMTAALLLLVAAGWLGWRATRDEAGASEQDRTGSAPEVRPAIPLWVRPLSKSGGDLTIQGTVEDADGPVSGAIIVATGVEAGETLSELSCHCDNDCGFKLLVCGCPEAAAQLVQLVSERRGEAPPVARSTSGTDGSFELHGLADGVYALWAQGKQLVGLEQPVRAGASKVRVMLAGGQTLRGKVQGGDGKPLAGAVVTGVYVEHSRFFDAVSGADGTFSIGPIPRGKVAVVAVKSTLLPDHAAGSEHHEPLSFTLHQPRTLRGRIERGGSPVAAASVVMEGQHRKRRVTSDRSGRFELGELRPGGYVLTALAGLDRGELSVQVTAGHDPASVILNLGPGGEVTGQVTSGVTGKPVPGARVHASADADDSSASASTYTDSAGAFRVGPLPGGTATLSVHAKGFLAGSASGVKVSVGTNVRRNVQLTPSVSIQGRVLDPEGTPVSGALVAAMEASDPKNFAASVTSGIDGAFELEGLHPTHYGLVVTHERFRSLSKDSVPAPSSGISLRLASGPVVVGEIRTAAGPIRTPATIWAVPVGEAGEADRRWSPRQRRAESGANGRFRLEGVEPGEYWLRAKLGDESSGRYTSTKLTIPEGSAQVSVRLVLEDGKSIIGKVLDRLGAPLEGVTIKATPPTDADERPSAEEQESIWRATGNTVSRADGTFVIADLTASEYLLYPTKAGYRLRPGQEAPRVRAGASEVRLTLEPVPVIRGRVTRPDGTPVTPFFLNGESIDSENGSFTMPIRKTGPVRIAVWTTDLAAAERTVEVRDDASVDLEPFVLDEGRPLLGTVVDLAGKPIEGALVDIGAADGPSRRQRMFLSTRTGAVRTDAEGRFRLPHVPGATSTLLVTHPHYAHHVGTVGERSSVTVTLSPGARIVGDVKDASGARLSARVIAFGEQGLVRSEMLEDGTYVLWGLGPGQYTRAGCRGLRRREQARLSTGRGDRPRVGGPARRLRGGHWRDGRDRPGAGIERVATGRLACPAAGSGEAADRS